MNKITAFVVCGIDYDDHVNDRGYKNRRDAEARKMHLEGLCNSVPTIEDIVTDPDKDGYPDEAWEQLDRDIIAFCIANDYPRDMTTITKFKIEELEVY